MTYLNGTRSKFNTINNGNYSFISTTSVENGGGQGIDFNQANQLYVNKAGDVLTGFLTLNADPINNLHPTTKQYVDAIANTQGNYLPITGGILTGSLTLSGPPAQPLHATTKAYVDTIQTTLQTDKVSKSGDNMTGFLTLPLNPTQPLHASTKQYVDAVDAKLVDFVKKDGSTPMDNPLLLSGDPTQPLEAATKQYVDLHLPKTGGVMTGPITMNSNPQNPLEVATKQYVDDNLISRIGDGTNGVYGEYLYWDGSSWIVNKTTGVHLGYNAGVNQGLNCVALGSSVGTNQGTDSVSIGHSISGTGVNQVGIGHNISMGGTNNIVALGADITTQGTGTYIKPIGQNLSQDFSNMSEILGYDSSSGRLSTNGITMGLKPTTIDVDTLASPHIACVSPDKIQFVVWNPTTGKFFGSASATDASVANPLSSSFSSSEDLTFRQLLQDYISTTDARISELEGIINELVNSN